MRQTLAERIGLGHILVQVHRTTIESVANKSYHTIFTVRLQNRFRLTISPVYGDGNCLLYRTISHIIFENQNLLQFCKKWNIKFLLGKWIQGTPNGNIWL